MTRKITKDAVKAFLNVEDFAYLLDDEPESEAV